MKSTVTGHCPRQPSPARCSTAFLGVRGEGSGLPEWLRTAGRPWEADNNPAQNPWLTPERAGDPEAPVQGVIQGAEDRNFCWDPPPRQSGTWVPASQKAR